MTVEASERDTSVVVVNGDGRFRQWDWECEGSIDGTNEGEGGRKGSDYQTM
jgi:hypothetical protein